MEKNKLLKKEFESDAELLDVVDSNEIKLDPTELQKDVLHFLLTGEPRGGKITPSTLIALRMTDFALKVKDPTKVISLYKIAGIADKVDRSDSDPLTTALLKKLADGNSEDKKV